VEPTVASSAHPSESSNVSCTLQRVTSDPDIYIVPLDAVVVECSSSPGSPIYFLCLTEVCFAADADCAVIWSNSTIVSKHHHDQHHCTQGDQHCHT
ncbi:hypothetical protein INR49_028575, partial [Caranx melampygus]